MIEQMNLQKKAQNQTKRKRQLQSEQAKLQSKESSAGNPRTKEPSKSWATNTPQAQKKSGITVKEGPLYSFDPTTPASSTIMPTN